MTSPPPSARPALPPLTSAAAPSPRRPRLGRSAHMRRLLDRSTWQAHSRQDAHALKYQSRCVTIAGRDHCARSAQCIGRDRDQLMADSVHIRSFCAQGEPPRPLRSTAHSRWGGGDDPAPYECVSGLTAGWSLTLAVPAAQVRSSLAPPAGSCSACGDLLVDDATVADVAFRWGFTNLAGSRETTNPAKSRR